MMFWFEFIIGALLLAPICYAAWWGFDVSLKVRHWRFGLKLNGIRARLRSLMDSIR